METDYKMSAKEERKTLESKAQLFLLNANVFDLPIKNFKNDQMSIDTLYSGAVFGGYFLLDMWKKCIVEDLEQSPVNAYSVMIKNSDVEIYQIPRECFNKISIYERVSFSK
jgi:hypothetical protein